MCVILAGTAYTQPQNNGTICLPDSSVRNLVIAREQGKVYKEQVQILTERISGLKEQIVLLKEKDSITVAAYTEQIASLLEQKKLYEDQMKGYELLLKKERRKRRFTGIAGILTTAAVFYISTR